jgi:MoxR-like ATPase
VEQREDRTLAFHPGPLFANLVLADEINRAHEKTRPALLEAMGEKQITIGKTCPGRKKLIRQDTS